MQLVTGYNVLSAHYSLIKKVLEDHYNTLNSIPETVSQWATIGGLSTQPALTVS